MDAITKKIEVNGTGITVDRHEINPNIIYNFNTKQIQAVVNSYIGKNEKPVKSSRAVIGDVKPGDDFEKKIIDFVNKNLADLINNQKPA